LLKITLKTYKKNNIMINWVNSWKSGNKKNKYSLTFRLGTLTVFEFKFCPCNNKSCSKFRFMIFNLGFEL